MATKKPDKWVSREQWGARRSRGASTLNSTRGVKIHYTGGREDPAMHADHKRCYARMRQIQNGHMDDRGWNDFAYSLAVCVHGYVFEGRGEHVLPAANGEGLNSGHYAVLGMIGNAGITEPTPAMLEGLCAAIDYLRRAGNAGGEIKGHRDGYATDCPGTPLYRWVKTGPCKGTGHDDDEGETDMPRHVKVELGKAQALEAGEWAAINWRAEVRDPEHQHADEGGPSVLNGPAVYSLTAGLTLEGLPDTAVVQVRAVEVDADGKEGATLGPIAEYPATAGKTFIAHNVAAGRVLEGRRVRVQVKPIGGGPTVTAASCELLFWR